ncbi:unnamed protein product [Euphydryas editha]|uniref:Ig-like domain-containing protein n=1 Tax=Euphydryas editha TaxID=104508 RepID=A0AAU9TKK1_EUPED|nr:unnamed protein product [Euphydryas editha]
MGFKIYAGETGQKLVVYKLKNFNVSFSVSLDVEITWSLSPRTASLPCAVVDWNRVPRRPPPLIDEDRPRLKPFIWRKGDYQIKSKRVSSNGTLELSRKSDGDSEGVYQCAVWDHGGQILGYPVHLKFSCELIFYHSMSAQSREGLIDRTLRLIQDGHGLKHKVPNFFLKFIMSKAVKQHIVRK